MRSSSRDHSRSFHPSEPASSGKRQTRKDLFSFAGFALPFPVGVARLSGVHLSLPVNEGTACAFFLPSGSVKTVSLLGTSLTGFAMGVWVYQKNGSATEFSLIWICNLIPNLLFSPLGGKVADRFNRRLVMLVSDGAAGFMTLVMLFLVMGGGLNIGLIYAITAFNSACAAFQHPAYMAGISQMVPRQQMGRAVGMVQASGGGCQILAPLLAGMMLGFLEIHHILLFDLLTFVIGVMTLNSVDIPDLPGAAHLRANPSHSDQGLAPAIRFLRGNRGLIGVLLYLALFNFLSGMVSVIATPYILSFATVETLGFLTSVGGVAMLCGSIGVSLWGGHRHLIRTMMICNLLASMGLIAVGMTRAIWVIGLGSFLFFSCHAVFIASNQVLWQLKVPLALQGRVLSLRKMVAWSSIPLAYLLAAPWWTGYLNRCCKTPKRFAVF